MQNAANCTEGIVMRVTVEPDLPRYSTSGWCDCMFSGRFTQTTLRALDWLASKTLAPDRTAQHLRTGRQGEEDAYFYLRRRGYLMIARNYRSPNYRGELDLVGWDGDVLCFIEVKTRTTRAVKPAEAAVDRDKQKDLSLVAGDFLRHMPPSCQTRFDIVSIYYDRGFKRPSIELFQNAFSVSYNPRSYKPRSYKHGFARS